MSDQQPSTTEGRAPEALPSDAEMNAAAPRGRRFSNGLAWLVSAAIAYVLSPLPMGVALDLLPYRTAKRLEPGVRAMYAPLTWLYERNEQVKDFYVWYEGLLDS